MKIFKDKNGHVTIVFSKNETPECTLVHDRGPGKLTNYFGGEVSRYAYHVANANGDSGHASYTNDFKELKQQRKYILKRSKQK